MQHRIYDENLNSAKINRQYDEWDNIQRKLDNMKDIKTLCHALFTFVTIACPFSATLYIEYAAKVDVIVDQSNEYIKCSGGRRQAHECAEELLRHYYDGHKSLGVGITDTLVAKSCRFFNFKSRNHASTVQAVLGEYKAVSEKYLLENPQATPEQKNISLPRILLETLKNELIAKKEAINYQGDLSAIVHVIQDKCQAQVINFQTLSQEIEQGLLHPQVGQ